MPYTVTSAVFIYVQAEKLFQIKRLSLAKLHYTLSWMTLYHTAGVRFSICKSKGFILTTPVFVRTKKSQFRVIKSAITFLGHTRNFQSDI